MPKRSTQTLPDGTVRELPRGVSWDKDKQQYRVQYADVDGTKRREFYSSLSKATAVAKERRATVKRVRIEGRLDDGAPAEPTSRGVGETIVEYVQVQTQEHPRTTVDSVRYGQLWNAELGDLALNEVTAKHARDWRQRRLERGYTKGKGDKAKRYEYSPATLNRNIDWLRAFLTWCVKQEYLDRNPLGAVDSLVEDNERLRYLDDQVEEPALEAAMGDCWHYAIVAMDTGLRQSEQFRIRREHLDRTHNLLHVPHTKTNRRRAVPLTPRARAAIEQQLASHDSPWLYPSPSNRPQLANSHATFESVRRRFEAALQVAGIHDFHWHDLRHTFCSRLAMSGADLATIMQLSGHSSLAAVQRYLHVSAAHRQDAVARMADRYGAAPIPAHQERMDT